MSMPRTVFVVLLLLWGVPCGAAPVRATLASLYTARDLAASRRDAAQCMKICAPDFAYFVGTAPPLTFARAQNKLSRGFSALRAARVATTVQALTRASDGATVLARETTQATLAGSPSPSGSTLVVTRKVRDFWAQTPAGTWKLKRRRLLATFATVNGVAVRTNTPSPPR